MAGTVATAGAAFTLAFLAVGLAGVAGATVHVQRLHGTADAAALAAADALSGAVPGDPCVDAENVARAGAARLEACDLDGAIVTVTVASAYGGIPLDARARAGPPRR